LRGGPSTPPLSVGDLEAPCLRPPPASTTESAGDAACHSFERTCVLLLHTTQSLAAYASNPRGSRRIQDHI